MLWTLVFILNVLFFGGTIFSIFKYRLVQVSSDSDGRLKNPHKQTQVDRSPWTSSKSSTVCAFLIKTTAF